MVLLVREEGKERRGEEEERRRRREGRVLLVTQVLYVLCKKCLICRFAFNCGSTESVESKWNTSYPPPPSPSLPLLIFSLSISPGPRQIFGSSWSPTSPYYAIPSIIAVNMILAVAAGGTTAIVIAVWAQV